MALASGVRVAGSLQACNDGTEAREQENRDSQTCEKAAPCSTCSAATTHTFHDMQRALSSREFERIGSCAHRTSSRTANAATVGPQQNCAVLCRRIAKLHAVAALPPLPPSLHRAVRRHAPHSVLQLFHLQ